MKMYKKLEGVIFIIVAIIFILPSIGKAQDGSILYFNFDEGTGTTLYDRSGTHNGTITGATYVKGKYGYGLRFTGTDSVNVPSQSDFNFGTSPFSFEFWFKADNLTDVGGILVRWNTVAYLLQTGGAVGAQFLLYLNDVSNFRYGGATISLGTWYHIVYVKNGTSLDCYRNGELANGSLGGTIPADMGSGPDTQAITLGSALKGTLDEFRIYNKALTQSEIQANYNRLHSTNLYVPLNLMLVYDKSKRTATLTWSAPQFSSLITMNNYKIYRKKGSGVWSLLTTLDGSTTTYIDKGFELNSNYSYYITSLVTSTEANIIGVESTASNIVSTGIISSEKTKIDSKIGGEVLAIEDNLTKIIIPSGVLSKSYNWLIYKVSGVNINNQDKVVAVYDITTSDIETGEPVSVLDGSIRINLHSTIAELKAIDLGINTGNVKDTVKVGFWNGREWLPLTSEVTVDSNDVDVNVVAKTNHLTQYGITTKTKSGEVRVKVYPNPFTPKAGQYNIAYFTFENVDNEYVEVRIWDVTGRLERTLTGYGNSITWDGKNENGEYVEGGVYIFQLKIGNSGASKGTIVVAY